MTKALTSYAIVGATGVLLLAPAFLTRLGTRRHPPLTLLRIESAGTALARADAQSAKTRILSVAVDDGPPRLPGRLDARRQMDMASAGTRFTYVVADFSSGERRVLSGAMSEASETPANLAGDLVQFALSATLALGGIALGLAGADRRAALGAAVLSGLAVQFGSVLLEPTVSLLGSDAARIVTIGWTAFPGNLTFFLLAWFVSVFPTDISRSPGSLWSRWLLFLSCSVTDALDLLLEIPGGFDSLAVSKQVWAAHAVTTLKAALLSIAALMALGIVVLQVRAYRRAAVQFRDRGRARIAGRALVFGVAPVLAIVITQALWKTLTRQLLLSPLVVSLAFLPLLLVPVALAYAILTPEVQSLRLLVRRAALFSFGEVTVRVISLLPLAGLLIFLYRNREKGLGELASAHPGPIAIAVAAALVGLLYRDRARRALERVFFRDRDEARRVMGELAEKSRAVRDPSSLEQLLSGEIGRALHAESVALFVHDRVSGAFVCPSRSLPTLDFDSVLLSTAGTHGVLELDPADRRSPLASLPEIERHWVEESHARLVLPLSGADGSVIGLLTVGENLSELAWDKDDRSLLVAAAASGALALENSLLRSSAGAGSASSRPPATGEEEDLARTCHLCSQIFSAALGPLCPKDQVPLTVAGVPHVLAGKYRFERRIGAGGMGVVYLARDLSLGRFVAVKTLPKVSPEAAMRLRREARATARVLHPNLAVIFAAETWHGTPMLLLEYLEGGTLAPRIARGPVPIERIVEWGIALSGALEAAHAKGVLHRDIKPSNIGFTASGEPKLLDFGLASLFEEPELLAAVETATKGLDMLETAELKHMTVSGRIVGTLPYLAPEAILGETPQVSFDLWSLALTLYEATTGRNPFYEMPAEKTLNRILSETPPPARSVREDCPEKLSTFFANALARKPASRPRTAREFHRALRRLASDLAA